MQVAYPAKGTPVYYRCQTRSVDYAEPFCQSLAGGSLEALVTEQVLPALEPAALELSLQAVADLERERQRLDQHWQQRLERARIEAERAARQYHAVEPENRLVARELERRWEQALREQRGLEEQYDRFKADAPREPTAADRQRIEAWAGDLPGLWHAPSTTIQDRKTIVRFLVERITVAVRGQTEWVDVTIRWAGGLESRHEVRRPVRKYEQLSNYQALRDRMIELRRAGTTTGEIAERLNQRRLPSPARPCAVHSVHRQSVPGPQGVAWHRERDGGSTAKTLAAMSGDWAIWRGNWRWRSTPCGTGRTAGGSWGGCRRRSAEPGFSGPTRRNWNACAGFVPGVPSVPIKGVHQSSRLREVAKEVDETSPPKHRGIQTAMRLIAKGEQLNNP